jgi:hypothetical protein
MKECTIAIQSPRGVTVSIGFYPDTPNKNFRIYYCGSDTGLRYERLGNAAKRIEQYARDWAAHGVSWTAKRGTAKDVPTR